MKTFFPFCFLTILLLLAFVLQDAVPSIGFLGQVPLILVPTIFCFAALALTFPLALFFSLITAIISGLMIIEFPNDSPEIGLSWFVFFFMAWFIALQFLNDLTEGVRWEVHAIGSALCTTTLLFAEFLLLSLKRGHFSITERAMVLIITPGVISLFIAPLFYGFLQIFLLPATPAKR
ncbi:MAG: hypothetical protein ACH346_01435 [Chthoniobacterales bacterium]